MMPSIAAPILLVDDTTPIVRIYRHYLKQMGLKDVDAASNGLEAINMLRSRRYAAIISDWHMQPISGFQLLQMVRADPDYAQVPFIMATIEGRQDYIEAAEAAGVTDYMLKPFNAAALRRVIINASPVIGAVMEPPVNTKGLWSAANTILRPDVKRPEPPPAHRPLPEPLAGPC